MSDYSCTFIFLSRPIFAKVSGYFWFFTGKTAINCSPVTLHHTLPVLRRWHALTSQEVTERVRQCSVFRRGLARHGAAASLPSVCVSIAGVGARAGGEILGVSKEERLLCGPAGSWVVGRGLSG